MQGTDKASYFCNMQQRIKGWIGPMPKEGCHVHIAGAGIAGLLAGWYLKKAGYTITIFEKNNRPGGLIHSTQSAYGLTESAANGILWSQDMHALCKELQLEPIAANKDASKRYILRNGNLRRIPLNWNEIPPLLYRLLRSYTLTSNDLNLDTFGNKVLGKSVTQYLLQPAMYGIYGSDIAHLGVRAIFPDFYTDISQGKTLFQAVNNLRPVKVKDVPKGLHSFSHGMQSLVDALYFQLQNDVKLNTEAPLPDNNVFTLCTMPAWAAAQWLMPVMTKIAQTLKSIEYAPLVSVTVICKQSDFTHLPKGFGVLIPPQEKYTLLGVLLNHVIFPDRVIDEKYVSLTCIMGGKGRTDISDNSDDAIMKIVSQELKRLFGLQVPPIEYAVHPYKYALPLYSNDLADCWVTLGQQLSDEKHSLSFLGNYTGEISIRGMNSVAARVGREVVK